MPERKIFDLDGGLRDKFNWTLNTLIPQVPENLDPNMITALGGLLGLSAAGFLSQGYTKAAFISYLGAGLADVADGYVARRLNKVSPFGALHDAFWDRGGDFFITDAQRRFALKKGWRYTPELALLARPLVPAPAIARGLAEQKDISVAKQSWGSRLPRSILTGICLALPRKPVWDASLGYIVLASGATTFSRLREISDQPELMETVFEIVDDLGKKYAKGVAPEVADFSLIDAYALIKAETSTGQPVQNRFNDVLTFDSYFDKAATFVSIVQSGYNIYQAMNHVLQYEKE